VAKNIGTWTRFKGFVLNALLSSIGPDIDAVKLPFPAEISASHTAFRQPLRERDILCLTLLHVRGPWPGSKEIE
jgi:hypothetical protein